MLFTHTLAITAVQSHLKVDDADMRMENLDSSYLGWANGKPEIVVNCPVRFLF